MDLDGSLIVADVGTHQVHKILPDGTMQVLAGTGLPGFQDGCGPDALFNKPVGVALTQDGHIIVADSGNNCIRKIIRDLSNVRTKPIDSSLSVATNTRVTTLAGGSASGLADGHGPCALFNQPKGVAQDGYGNIVVADTRNNCIRLMTVDGTVTTLAGSSGTVDDNLFDPQGVAITWDGNVIVADTGNNCIRSLAAGLQPVARSSKTLFLYSLLSLRELALTGRASFRGRCAGTLSKDGNVIFEPPCLDSFQQYLLRLFVIPNVCLRRIASFL
eukprot:TRINITY_DN27552_c0_g1_i1.p1 TRINITY_DN27552_c0_g1~~TRINITY_DN27552_c0_g1_i1.p1  ORF type:complete len:273 (+),score=46.52 TRINITY_DN27552_c0_g1_i1:3-821(+)